MWGFGEWGGRRVHLKGLNISVRLFSLPNAYPRSDVLLHLRSGDSHGAAKGPQNGLLGGAQVPGRCRREGDRGVLTDLVVFATAFRQMPTSLEACCFHQQMKRTIRNACLSGFPYRKERCTCRALSTTCVRG